MRRRIAWLITTGLVASALAVPGIAVAHTNEAIAETGGMELALLGAELTVDIGLDELGNITTIDVIDPSVGPEGEAIEVTDPHRMRFEIDEDGTRLAVMAKKHKLTSKVKAGTFDALLGQHDWSTELFTGTPVTVLFTVSGTPAAPLVTVDEIVGLPEDEYEISSGAEDDDGNTRVMITFTRDGYTKVLKIKVAVDDDDDEDGPSAVLKIELRAKDRQRLRGDLSEFTGDHLWTGRLCDNSTVTVSYSIADDGALTVGDVSGAEHTVKEQQRGFQVRFDGTKARLRVKFGQTDEGTWDLKVDAKTTEKCKHDDGERGKKNRSERAKNKDDGAGDEADGD